MKHLNTILLFLTISVTAFAQTPDSLTFQFSDLTLRQALQEISTKTGVQFIFSDALIDGKSVNGCFVGASIDSTLHHLLTDTQIAFRHIKNGRIVLHPSDQRIIKGYVYDAENGQGLPFANITLKGTDHGTAANDQGYFALANYITDPCTLSVSYIGYQPGEVIADVQGGTSPVSVPLANDPIMTRELTVTGKKTPLLELQGSPGYIKFAPKQMEAIPSTGSNELHRAIQFMPGVSGIQEKPEGLYVMGGTPDQNLVLLDGMPIYKSTHFFGLVSAFHPDAIDSVELHLSGYPAQYGGHLSSVMQYHVDSAIGKPLKLGAGVDFMQMYAHARVPVSDKIGVTLAARRTFSDVTKSRGFDKVYRFISKTVNSNNGPLYIFYDITTRLDLDATTNDNISITYYDNRDYINRIADYGPYNNNADNNIWRNKVVGLTWDHKWSDKIETQIKSTFTRTYSEYKKNDLSIFGFVNFTNLNTLQSKQLQINNKFIISPKFEFYIGAQYQSLYTLFEHNKLYEIDPENYFNLENNGSYSISTRPNIYNSYLEFNYRPLTNLLIQPGFRYNTTRTNLGRSKNPRITIQYQLDNFKIHSHFGHYHQNIYQKYGNYYYSGYTPFWLFSNSPGFLVHRNVGVSYNKNNFGFQIEGYYKTFHNINIPVSINGEFMTGSGASKGLNLTICNSIKQYKTWFIYHWRDIEHRIPGINNENPLPAHYLRKHEMKMVLEGKHNNWKLAISGIYASGKPYTPFSSTFRIDTYDGTNTKFYINGDYLSFWSNDYFRADLKLYRHIPNKLKMDWNVGINWLNFFEQNNTWEENNLDSYYSWWETKNMMPFVFMFFIQTEFNESDKYESN